MWKLHSLLNAGSACLQSKHFITCTLPTLHPSASGDVAMTDYIRWLFLKNMAVKNNQFRPGTRDEGRLHPLNGFGKFVIVWMMVPCYPAQLQPGYSYPHSPRGVHLSITAPLFRPPKPGAAICVFWVLVCCQKLHFCDGYHSGLWIIRFGFLSKSWKWAEMCQSVFSCFLGRWGVLKYRWWKA